MARVGLGLGVRQLAIVAKVSPTTIAKFEAGRELKARTIEDIAATLEGLGVLFIAENGEGQGVRFRKDFDPAVIAEIPEPPPLNPGNGRYKALKS